MLNITSWSYPHKNCGVNIKANCRNNETSNQTTKQTKNFSEEGFTQKRSLFQQGSTKQTTHNWKLFGGEKPPRGRFIKKSQNVNERKKVGWLGISECGWKAPASGSAGSPRIMPSPSGFAGPGGIWKTTIYSHPFRITYCGCVKIGRQKRVQKTSSLSARNAWGTLTANPTVSPDHVPVDSLHFGKNLKGSPDLSFPEVKSFEEGWRDEALREERSHKRGVSKAMGCWWPKHKNKCGCICVGFKSVNTGSFGHQSIADISRGKNCLNLATKRRSYVTKTFEWYYPHVWTSKYFLGGKICRPKKEPKSRQ